MTFPEMKIDKAPFAVHTIDLSNSKMLIRPEQAEGVKEKKVIIGDKRQITIKGMILVREVVREKTHDGEKTLKISIEACTPGGLLTDINSHSSHQLLRNNTSFTLCSIHILFISNEFHKLWMSFDLR